MRNGAVTVEKRNDVAAKFVSVVVATMLVKTCCMVTNVEAVWTGVENVADVVVVVLKD